MISYKIVKLWKDHVYIPTGNINEWAGLYDIHGPASIFKVSYILFLSHTSRWWFQSRTWKHNAISKTFKLSKFVYFIKKYSKFFLLDRVIDNHMIAGKDWTRQWAILGVERAVDVEKF